MGLEQSILETGFMTFIHNQYAIAFFAGVVISFGLLLYKPSRHAAILLTGFIVLLFGFEYNKHIIQPFQDQTLTSLSLNQSNKLIKLFVSRAIQKILPLAFFVVGWGSVFLAIITATLKKPKP